MIGNEVNKVHRRIRNCFSWLISQCQYYIYTNITIYDSTQNSASHCACDGTPTLCDCSEGVNSATSSTALTKRAHARSSSCAAASSSFGRCISVLTISTRSEPNYDNTNTSWISPQNSYQYTVPISTFNIHFKYHTNNAGYLPQI